MLEDPTGSELDHYMKARDRYSAEATLDHGAYAIRHDGTTHVGLGRWLRVAGAASQVRVQECDVHEQRGVWQETVHDLLKTLTLVR